LDKADTVSNENFRCGKEAVPEAFKNAKELFCERNYCENLTGKPLMGDPFLSPAEREARQESKGLWQDEPTEQTEPQKEETAAPCVASKNSEVYHKASCSSAQQIKAENLIRFKSVEEARESGRRECKKCFD
jgi:hypothetical protein